MPDIEIHGIPLNPNRANQAMYMMEKVARAFEDAPYGGTLCFVTAGSGAISAQAQEQVFLRILGRKETIDALLPDMLERLEPLKLDIEIQHLVGYIQAKK